MLPGQTYFCFRARHRAIQIMKGGNIWVFKTSLMFKMNFVFASPGEGGGNEEILSLWYEELLMAALVSLERKTFHFLGEKSSFWIAPVMTHNRFNSEKVKFRKCVSYLEGWKNFKWIFANLKISNVLLLKRRC